MAINYAIWLRSSTPHLKNTYIAVVYKILHFMIAYIRG